jgi:hypothetical protein
VRARSRARCGTTCCRNTHPGRGFPWDNLVVWVHAATGSASRIRCLYPSQHHSASAPTSAVFVALLVGAVFIACWLPSVHVHLRLRLQRKTSRNGSARSGSSTLSQRLPASSWTGGLRCAPPLVNWAAHCCWRYGTGGASQNARAPGPLDGAAGGACAAAALTHNMPLLMSVTAAEWMTNKAAGHHGKEGNKLLSIVSCDL